MSTILKHLLAGAAMLSVPTLALAEMSATTMTDMEVYSGPGTEYPSVGTATRGSQAMLDGCVEGSNWCRIDVNGMRGWVYAENLSVDHGGSAVVIQDNRADLNVPTITYEKTGSVVAPVDPAPGDELLGRVGDVTPPDTVRTYIEANPMDTVTYDSDVVIGATLPETVTMGEIPDYEYRYVRVNDRRVLVDPGTRRIVYVYQ